MVKLIVFRILLIILGIIVGWLLYGNYKMFENVNKEYPKSEVSTYLAFNVVVFFVVLIGCIVKLVML